MDTFDGEEVVDGLMEIWEGKGDGAYRNAVSPQRNSMFKNPRMSLDQALHKHGILPEEALFLGMAYDSLPVLLNMDSKTISSILVVSPRSIDQMFYNMARFSRRVEYLVITNKISNYKAMENSNSAVSIYSSISDQFILSLASWAHQKDKKSRILLYIDCFDEVREKLDFDAKQNLRWLLLNGAKGGVITLAHQTKLHHDVWEDAFHSKVFATSEFNEYGIDEETVGGKKKPLNFYSPV